MNSKTLYRYGAPPLLALGLTAPALLGGCGDDALNCEADIVARVNAFQGAVDALIAVSAEVKGSIAVACSNIATELGESPPDVGDGSAVTDDDMQTACNLASAAISASITANGSISIQVIGGKCEVAADAQLSCEASCSVDGSCDPGSVDVRCEGGDLSGSCSAECTGSCTVETGSITCEGSCSGTCSGTCEGTCEATGTSGACEGACTGNCDGECTGTCEVVPASVECSGSCKGGCSVAYTAPTCEGEMTPPSCELDAECSGGCDAQGSISAECTPPEIIIEGNAELVTVLEANLPAIFLLVEVQGELLLDSSVYVAETAIGVAEAAITVPACVATFGADLVASFSGAVEAQASVSVSVSASAEVGGSTS